MTPGLVQVLSHEGRHQHEEASLDWNPSQNWSELVWKRSIYQLKTGSLQLV